MKKKIKEALHISPSTQMKIRITILENLPYKEIYLMYCTRKLFFQRYPGANELMFRFVVRHKRTYC